MRYIGNFRNIATKLNIYTTELLICIERENLSKLIRKLSFFKPERKCHRCKNISIFLSIISNPN